MSCVYLIKRGPRPEYHKAPFHPVIICGTRHVAKREAGWTGDAAWVWSHERGTPVGGWLLERWKGFDVDYGHVVRGVVMPDGTEAGFVHAHTGREPWTLIAGAVWWDDRKVPQWLADAGVVYPSDDFTQQSIVNRMEREPSGFWRRSVLDFWPATARGDGPAAALRDHPTAPAAAPGDGRE